MTSRVFCLYLLTWLTCCSQPTASTIETRGSYNGRVIATQSDGTVWIGPAHYRIVKPQTLGIADAPTIWQAMTPLVSTPSRGGEGVDAYIHPQGNGYMATVLRELKEGPATADEVLVSFDRAGVGWRPTAAYKREVCRGTPAAQWTTGPCT